MLTEVLGFVRYLEGINILYSTNSFVLDNRLLTQNLAKLLLPQSLALIASLELTWEASKPPTSDLSKPHEWPEPFDLPFSFIKRILPGLRVLHLSLHGDTLSVRGADVRDPETRGLIDAREQVIFTAVKDIFESTNLQVLYLGLNWTLWNQLRTKESRKKGHIFKKNGYPGPRFWRSIGDRRQNNADIRGCWVVKGLHGW